MTKRISHLGAEEIQALVRDAIPEGSRLEYKQTLPGNDHRSKREFLADISALANTEGGIIVFGIIEDPDSGIPREVCGLNFENTAEETTRLAQLLSAAIEPRIESVSFQWLDLPENKQVLVVEVAASWHAPHRVILEGHDKFYARSANRKYPMDTHELRQAFNRRLELEYLIRERRNQRMALIAENRTFLTFGQVPRFALFLTPTSRGSRSRSIDTRRLAPDFIQPFLPPRGVISVSTHENFEGRLWYYRNDYPWVRTYVQIFRDGLIEAATDSLFHKEDDLLFPEGNYENSIVEMVAHYLRCMSKVEMGSSASLSLALLAVQGLTFRSGFGQPPSDETYRAQTDVLVSPEVLLEGPSGPIRAADLTERIRPCLDPFRDAFSAR